MSSLTRLAFALPALASPACDLPVHHTCHGSQDCLTGECRAGICSDREASEAASPAPAAPGSAFDASLRLEVGPDVSNRPEASTEAGPDVSTIPETGSNDTATSGEAALDSGADAPRGSLVDAPQSPCPAWADWPMPQPSSLTGIAGDPQRSLPNPQSYDTTSADIVVDKVTQLAWQKVASTNTVSFAQAEAYCSQLTLAGRTDWRVPSRLELVSIIDFAQSRSGNIDNGAFPADLAVFWACTAGPASPLVAWTVDFGQAIVITQDKLTQSRVRCVAGAITSTPPPTRYAADASGAVRDVKTMLTWQTTVSPPVNWGQAFDYCQSLGAGWRLPSVTELQTLIDEAQAAAAFDPTAFPDRPDDYYWTSSYFDGNTRLAWFVSIGMGNTYWLPTSDVYYARCVR